MEPEYKEVKNLTKVGYELHINVYGSKQWYLDGELHREGGPAIEWADGDKWWFLNGKQHREDGPARVWASGSKEWFLNDIKVSERDFKEVWECPLDRLPLYINTEFAPIVKRRLSKGHKYQI